MKVPRVSVVMPVFDAERYVAEAIESVLAQTLADFEFVIVDDGSTDQSPEILQRYAERDRRIVVLAKPHRGIVASLNDGIATASAELIARMDADDVSFPSRFSDQVDYLTAHADCAAVGCATLQIDEDGLPIRPQIFETSPAQVEHDLFNGGLDVLPHPGSMIRKSALTRVGGYRPEYQHVEDFDLWLRLVDHGQLANVPQIGLKYRQHSGSVCFRMGEVQKRLAVRALAEARRRRGMHGNVDIDFCGMPREGVGLHIDWAVAALGAGYRHTAAVHASRALRQRPLSIRAWTVLAGCAVPVGLTRRVKASKPLRSLSRWLHSPAA